MWPVASRSSRLVFAAMIWSLVGAGLMVAGTWFSLSGGWLAGAAAVVIGLALGYVKGHYLLAGMARANAARIESGPGRATIFTAFPLSSWIIAFFFMALGLVIRRSGLPPALVGFVYVAAGFGLLVASCSGWRAWVRSGARVTDP